MYKYLIGVLLFFTISSCKQRSINSNLEFFEIVANDSIPKEFAPATIPKNLLIHKCIFSPDLDEYYYTLSDKNFNHFDVYVLKYKNGSWSDSEKAFFNSDYDDHGMSFSPDGNSIYFSSTRPKNQGLEIQTWQIWKSEKVDGLWTNPQSIDISNLIGKLVSHPTITESGDLYFHSSNVDYSEMHLYNSNLVNGKYANAEKIDFKDYQEIGECTPFVSPKGDYLLFASIGNELTLMISLKDKNGGWQKPKALNKTINTKGQGNPFVTQDNQFLFYTTGGHTTKEWEVKCVKFDSGLIY